MLFRFKLYSNSIVKTLLGRGWKIESTQSYTLQGARGDAGKQISNLTSSLPETETVSDLPPKAPVTRVGRFSCVTLDVDKIAAKLEASSDYRVRKKLDLKQIRV